MTDWIKLLIKYGASVYIVGGANRDYLYNLLHGSNIKIKDYDFLIIGLDSRHIMTLLEPYGKIKTTGLSFGVIMFKHDGDYVEIAIPRKEYYDTQKNILTIIPNHNLRLEEDLERRDAPINAIVLQIYSLDNLNKYNNGGILLEEFIDHFNGIHDIKNKIWKTIGFPIQRFVEDPSRIMRCLRQSAELGLTIEYGTLLVINNNSNLLKSLIPKSYVKIFDEFFKILQCYDVNNFINITTIMINNGLLDIIGIHYRGVNKLSAINDNNIFIQRFASLLSPDTMDMCYIKWYNERSLGLLKYITKIEQNYLIALQLYYDEFKLVVKQEGETKYSVLWFGNKLYVKFGNNVDILLLMMQYYELQVGNNNNNNNIDMIRKHVNDIINYPFCENKIDLNGNDIIKLWNITGKKIVSLKCKILDAIYKDTIKNNKLDIINFVNNVVLPPGRPTQHKNSSNFYADL